MSVELYGSNAYLPQVENNMTGLLVYRLEGQEHQLKLVQRENVSGPGLTASLEVKHPPLQISIRLTPQSPVELVSCQVERQTSLPAPFQILANGFQSWTHSQEYGPMDKLPAFRAPFANLFNQSGDYTFYHNPGEKARIHSHFVALLRVEDRYQGLVDLLQETGYTIFEFHLAQNNLRILKDCAGLLVNQPMNLLHVREFHGSLNECKAELAALFPAPKAKIPVSGWTSWYNYYTDIDEEIILENLNAFVERQLPIDFFQIDDGWQPAVGDWLHCNARFPNGFREIVSRAHAHGIQAGLWLAPFIVDQRSTILKEHPDWVLTYDGERRVSAGFNPLWGGAGKARFFALDVYHPEVRAYLRQVFDRILNEWDFDLVKLDFLYAAALLSGRGRSRGQIMVEAIAFLRECCGNKAILGCGVPLGPCMGLVEYCRIGPDIGLNWDMKSLAAVHFRERISTRNALHNTISRHLLGQTGFANDPDVFILRNENNSLSELEKESLLLTNYIFGDLTFTSDNLNAYSPGQMRQYRSAFPLVERNIHSIVQENDLYECGFSIGALSYRFWLNLGKKTAKIQLPQGIHFQQAEGLVQGGQSRDLPPHACFLILLEGAGRTLKGSDGHLFPGADVTLCRLKGQSLLVERNQQTLPKARVWVETQPGSILFKGRIYASFAFGGRRFVAVKT